MKIDATIDWVIDDEVLGITSSSFDKVQIDVDYVEANEESITEWIENELAKKYGVTLRSNEDFVIMNLDDLVNDLKMEEFNDKTELTINGPEM